jgi:hypothetical protein
LSSTARATPPSSAAPFAGALLDKVKATVVLCRELEWCGTWAWAGDTIAHRIDGKRTVRREVFDAIAVPLCTELVRRGAVDQSDAKTLTRAKPTRAKPATADG